MELVERGALKRDAGGRGDDGKPSSKFGEARALHAPAAQRGTLFSGSTQRRADSPGKPARCCTVGVPSACSPTF